MTISAYLAHRVAELTAAGQSRGDVLDRLVEATGLPVAAVEAALSGDDPPDLDEVGPFARALDLDEIEAIEVAANGTLLSRWFDDVEVEGTAVSRVLAPQVVAGLPPGQNEFIASTGKEARDGDIIDQESWRLGSYLRNPVILDTHSVRDVVGAARKVWVEGRGGADPHLRTIVEWDRDPSNPRGILVASQHERRIRRGISVSWITGKRVSRDALPETDPRFSAKPRKVETGWGTYERMGVVHFDSTLLEQSSVSVPSDPRALQVRGLGAAAGSALRTLSPTDAPAAVDLREHLRDLLSSPDEETVRSIGAIVARLVRTDDNVRGVLRGLVLSLDTPLRSAPRKIRGDLLDHLFTNSE